MGYLGVYEGGEGTMEGMMGGKKEGRMGVKGEELRQEEDLHLRLLHRHCPRHSRFHFHFRFRSRSRCH